MCKNPCNCTKKHFVESTARGFPGRGSVAGVLQLVGRPPLLLGVRPHVRALTCAPCWRLTDRAWCSGTGVIGQEWALSSPASSLTRSLNRIAIFCFFRGGKFVIVLILDACSVSLLIASCPDIHTHAHTHAHRFTLKLSTHEHVGYMPIYIYIYTCAHTHTRIHTHTYTHTHKHKHVGYMPRYIYTYTHVCMHTRAYTHTHTHTHA